MADEVQKLQTHLRLLREEYVKLQTRLQNLEKEHQVALAAAGGSGQSDNFVSRLLKTVADLFEKELYSDLIVKLEGSEVKAHRFVLAARSDNWGVENLSQCSEVDLSDIPYEVGHALLKWVYTDTISLKSDDTFLLALLRVSTRFDLNPLKERCEKALLSSVNVANCITYYQTAEEIGADTLLNHCSELISNHWHDFTSEDFASMNASLAYKMFKTKSEFPLHTAIRTEREDVVFLYLMEHDSQLPAKLNEVDTQGDLPLDLALVRKLEGIAATLIQHKVDVNRCDSSDQCLLHKAIKRGDGFSAKFLIDNRADVNAVSKDRNETALHLVANYDPEQTAPDVMEDMAHIAKLLVRKRANVNIQDADGNTPLHCAMMKKNEFVFAVFLLVSEVDLELQNNQGETPLWLALKAVPHNGLYTADSFATKLLSKGSSLNATNPSSGDCLLHLAARSRHEAAALFLANNGANGNISNHKGEAPIHTGCQQGLVQLTRVLLVRGANPNAQTSAPLDDADETDPFAEPVTKETPLHLAIRCRHQDVVKAIINYKAQVTADGNPMQIIPNFSLKDSNDQTVLALSLWNGFHDVATQLLAGGANINDYNSDGHTLLHQAILKADAAAAVYMLDRQANPNARRGFADIYNKVLCRSIRHLYSIKFILERNVREVLTEDKKTCLELAIQQRLPVVVDALCQRGADMNAVSASGDCALWQALESDQEDIASILVRHGCQTDMWSTGPGDCEQTLLHRAIDENNETIGCFLIRSQCDVNAPRRPGPEGQGDEEARDRQGPLHLAACWGQERVVQALVEHNADVNAQDAEGKAPIHVAITNQHHVIISLLLSHPMLDLTVKDKQGLTPFAAAMMTKNNKAAQAILDREPTAAEQMDNRGRNFLHLAIQKSDIESVLFLISVRANVNSRVQDSASHTPLHLAVHAGSEIIVRNLLLAGASVNDTTPQNQNALHIAASYDHSVIASILLENQINFDQCDENWYNALHTAVQGGHLNTVRVLLTESRINADALNAKGQNPMHMLGQYGRENAAAIFELFIECMPEYPIDKVDGNGNTVLLLAYINGNSNLCKAIVRAGARLGILNKEGISIFNAPVATKQLLFKLLDMLSKEPPWCEGETCLSCSVKFGIKTRKHHCRHCGRLLCAKCSDKDVPILKYNIPKPVRVCEICFDVLTLGASS